MSFAIIQTGGKQYKVKAGEIIKIEKFGDQKPNSIIEFKEILAYGDDKNVEVGLPTVQGAKVEAEFLKSAKNRTVLIFKKRRRKNSRRKNLFRIRKNKRNKESQFRYKIDYYWVRCASRRQSND